LPAQTSALPPWSPNPVPPCLAPPKHADLAGSTLACIHILTPQQMLYVRRRPVQETLNQNPLINECIVDDTPTAHVVP
jgi:hypothetical protein